MAFWKQRFGSGCDAGLGDALLHPDRCVLASAGAWPSLPEGPGPPTDPGLLGEGQSHKLCLLGVSGSRPQCVRSPSDHISSRLNARLAA